MENNFTITIKPNNPEFITDDKLREGLKAHGYMLITFDDDGDAEIGGMQNVCTMDIAHFLASSKNEICKTIRQACAIADGLRKAHEMEEEYESVSSFRDLLERIVGEQE